MRRSVEKDSPEALLKWCDAHDVSVNLVQHAPIGHTNEEAAKVLRRPINCILKSVVFQASPGGQFGVIQRGAARIDLRKVKSLLNTGKPNLVPPGILRRSLGAAPGTVSPFIFAMKGMVAVVDYTILEMDEVVATAGAPTHSIIFAPSVFRRLGYEIADVSEVKGERQ